MFKKQLGCVCGWFGVNKRERSKVIRDNFVECRRGLVVPVRSLDFI